MKINSNVSEDAASYASALDEIGGRATPDLAERLLEDDEDDATVKKALKKLSQDKRDEVRWTLGWFRGVADALGCDPIDVLKAGRTRGRFGVHDGGGGAA